MTIKENLGKEKNVDEKYQENQRGEMKHDSVQLLIKYHRPEERMHLTKTLGIACLSSTGYHGHWR